MEKVFGDYLVKYRNETDPVAKPVPVEADESQEQ